MLLLLGTTLTASFFDSLNPSAIAQQMANLCARPLVRTARQLLSYTRTIPDSENRVTPRFQREVDKAFEHELLA